MTLIMVVTRENETMEWSLLAKGSNIITSSQARTSLQRIRSRILSPRVGSFTSCVKPWLLATNKIRCCTIQKIDRVCKQILPDQRKIKTTHLFSLMSMKPAESFAVLSSQKRQDVFLHSFWESSFHSRMLRGTKGKGRGTLYGDQIKSRCKGNSTKYRRTGGATSYSLSLIVTVNSYER